MKRLFQITICLLTALHLVGGHWGILQMVAWTQMLNDYSKDKGILVAVKETFDGEHPCAMCLKIKEGRKQENENSPILPQAKVEKSSLWLTAQETNVVPAVTWDDPMKDTDEFAVAHLFAAQWASSPQTPPPRSGAV